MKNYQILNNKGKKALKDFLTNYAKEPNQALISLQNLTNEQKIQIVRALIEDICAFKFEHYEGDL